LPSAADAAGVKITQQQVANVCGKKLQTGGGHSGCTKACGLNGEHQCDFDCNNKTGKCEGQCLTCSARFIGKDSTRLVINTGVSASQ
jgi:hypothetical protein